MSVKVKCQSKLNVFVEENVFKMSPEKWQLFLSRPQFVNTL